MVWSRLMCIKVFKVKCIFNEISSFTIFSWYVCIWSHTFYKWCTNPICSFSPTFQVRSLNDFWRRLWRRLGVITHPSLVGPHLSMSMPLSSLWCSFSFKTLMFLSFSFWYWTLYDLYVVLFSLIYGLVPNLIYSY